MNQECPCGSEKTFEECCDAIIKGNRKAETAEELMRSRYVAFTRANVDYLMNTHHASCRPNKERKKIKRWAQSVEWISLSIVRTHQGLAHNEDGYVEFRATFIENDQYERIHENSYFKQENGKWFYMGGTDIDLLNEERIFQ